jgi:hypothetical protein
MRTGHPEKWRCAVNDTQRRIRALGGKLLRHGSKHDLYLLPDGSTYLVHRGSRVTWRALRAIRSLARKKGVPNE